jgi:patatin-related protein
MSNAIPSSTSAAATAAVPPFASPAASDGGPTKEVRFAVVMYGGVSLCIYINGIAQELLHMVRATAPGDDPGTLRYTDEQLSPIERVYRDLGRLLSEDRVPDRDPQPGDAVCTRFSVDILSGTSAGGINSIFLAKALANDGSMAQLKQLWMTEADIARLINDGASTRDTGLPRPSMPRALLNGQRMYQKLVEAFDGMDTAERSGDAPKPAPLVPEVDLFVTTTDIAGVTLPIRLSDGVVHERRHRGVFHFHLRPPSGADAADPAVKPEANDHFTPDYNPFLAFAARCTSAFPFAFEPMRLKDITAVLKGLDRYQHRDDWDRDPLWDPFLERFHTPAGPTRLEPRDRSFGDGGYLDNKPFSYASESLLRRESGIPVDRKLIYIEPKPEHPENEPARTEFDAIENVMAATVGLPRYETIREDLERVVARNRLTERVRIVTKAIESDLENAPVRRGIVPTSQWGKLYLADMVEMYGFAYGSYHRLRAAATTDWLATVVSRAAGLGDASDRVQAIRHLVRAWRMERYSHVPDPGPPPRESENQFLLDYDLDFRIRRLAYVLSKINTLFAPGEDEQRALAQMVGVLSATQEAEFRAELVDLKRRLHPLYRQMRGTQERLERRGDRNSLHARLKMLAVSASEIENLLALSGREQERQAERLLNLGDRRAMLQDTANDLKGRLEAVRVPVSRVMDELKEANHPPELSSGGRIARGLLWHYYDHYSDYDLVSFPILYSTDAGEEDTVDIIRISPEDARFIYDETKDALGRRKLAGTALFNFGGFLRDTWRANDILWGRLDGAERLICSLLPDEADLDVRDRLLERASRAILADEFKHATRTEVSRLMSQSLVHVAGGRPAESAVARLSAAVGNEQLSTRLQAVLGDCVEDDKLLAYFKEGYEVNRDLDPREALDLLARGSRVVGHMLEGITERHSMEGKRVQWVTRAATWFWRLVQVAVPRSLPALVFDHWLGLLYAFGLLQVLVGVFAGPAVMGWGVRLLAVTLLATLVVVVFRDYMRRRAAWAAGLVALLVLALAGLAAAGVAWIAENVVTRGAWDTATVWLPLGGPGRVIAVQGLCAVLGAAMALVAARGLARRRWGGWLPGGFSAPGLAAEFVGDADELTLLTRGALRPIPRKDVETGREKKLREQRDADIAKYGTDHPELRGKVLGSVKGDYVFIAAYWILFVLLADRLLGLAAGEAVLRPPAQWLAGFLGMDGLAGVRDVLRGVQGVLRVLGVGALVTGTAAAVLDVVENGRIYEAFTAARGREEKWMADGIRSAATWKWALVFVTVLLLSPLFLWSEAALAGFWVVVGLVGLAALWKKPRLVEWVMILLGLGLLAAAFLLPAA